MAGQPILAFLLITTAAAQNASETTRLSAFEDVVGEEEATEASTASTTEEASTLPSYCTCSPLSYTSGEMSAELKSPGYPETYCHNMNCTFDIEPHPDRAIRLSVESMRMETDHDFLTLYQYVVINSTRQIMFVRFLNQDASGVITAGKGVGFYIVMTTDVSVGGTFRLAFDRVEPETQSTSCPYPFLYADNTPRNITGSSDWPISGCIFRIYSKGSINLRSTCGPYNAWKLKGKYPGKNNLLFERVIDYEDSYDGDADTLDVSMNRYREYSWGRWKTMETCSLVYFSVDYDPCKCPPSRQLSPGESINITSPGYPNLLCRDITCVTTFTLPDTPTGYKSGFNLLAFHAARSYHDSLSFFVDSKNVLTLQSMQDTSQMSEPLSLVGKELKVQYKAYADFKGEQHGYAMTVAAVTVPVECLCSSNLPKLLLSKGSYSMTVPSKCRLMTCRFEIPAEGYTQKLFRLMSTYVFPNEGEFLTIETGKQKTKYESQGLFTVKRRLNMASDRKISLTYQRSIDNGNGSIISDQPSSFNLTWLWLGSNACSCGDAVRPATETWDDLFSPRYPDDYCLNLRCTYRIEAPIGHHIHLNVTFFETEPHTDFVTFFDGNDTTARHVLQLHGHIPVGPSMESTGRNATIVFNTDNSISLKGFVIAYRAVKDEGYDETLNEETKASSILIGILLTLLLLSSVFGIVFIKRKNVSFRNPTYIPTIRFSVNGEQDIFADSISQNSR